MMPAAAVVVAEWGGERAEDGGHGGLDKGSIT